jgi:uncharacterized protein (DUF697 family)
MKRVRHTPEKILQKLRQAAADRAQGRTIGEVCKRLEISQTTYRRWKRQYDGRKAEVRFGEQAEPSTEGRDFDEKQNDWWPLMELIGHQIKDRAATIATVLGHVKTAARRMKFLSEVARRGLFARLEKVAVSIPKTYETESHEPLARCQVIIGDAAIKAATVSGGLALPLGPLGALTLLPDLLLIWKIQAQMVADIAGTFGKEGTLTREHMIYCLCKQATTQAVRGLAIRRGRRVLVGAGRIRLVPRLLGRLSMPIVGAAGAAAFTYWDTMRVGRMAVRLFTEETNAPSARPATEAAAV